MPIAYSPHGKSELRLLYFAESSVALDAHHDTFSFLLFSLSSVTNLEPLTIKYRWKSGDVVLGQVQPNHSDRAFASGWISSLINVTAEAKAEDAVLNLLKDREASAVKAAEDAEQRRKIAVEEKHSQELLIDVVSHELRGPYVLSLSTIDLNNQADSSASLEQCERHSSERRHESIFVPEYPSSPQETQIARQTTSRAGRETL
jgi:hypothetical protein